MSESKGKIFENENDGMLMEFATGLKEYCKSYNNDCTGCIFFKESKYNSNFKTCSINHSVPENWEV